MFNGRQSILVHQSSRVGAARCRQALCHPPICVPSLPPPTSGQVESYRTLAQQSEEKRARAEDELLTTARLAASLEARLAAAVQENEQLRLEAQVGWAAREVPEAWGPGEEGARVIQPSHVAPVDGNCQPRGPLLVRAGAARVGQLSCTGGGQRSLACLMRPRVLPADPACFVCTSVCTSVCQLLGASGLAPVCRGRQPVWRKPSDRCPSWWRNAGQRRAPTAAGGRCSLRWGQLQRAAWEQPMLAARLVGRAVELGLGLQRPAGCTGWATWLVFPSSPPNKQGKPMHLPAVSVPPDILYVHVAGYTRPSAETPCSRPAF